VRSVISCKIQIEPTTFPLRWDEDGNILEAFSPDFYLVDQDLFVELLRPETRNRYDGLRPFGSFAGGVTRNVMLDRARRLGRQHKYIAQDIEASQVEDWLPHDPLPDELLIGGEQAVLVQRYIAGLPHIEQKIVQLRFAQGLSQRDAAQAAGLGRQQVRRLEDKIRDGLRKFLEDEVPPQT